MHGYKYLPDVIQSLEEDDMKKKEQWKKMSVRDSLDGFAKDKFELNLKKGPDVETFATFNTFKYHVFAPMGRFQLELFYLYFPPSFHLTGLQDRNNLLLDGRTVENNVKLILTLQSRSLNVHMS